jgi:hypothetical protein
MDGQKLLLLHARNRAANDDAAGVRELLAADLRFWRQVLASADILISKMIATTALNRHFKLGAEAIGLLPPERMSEAMPPEWQAEISDAERSISRMMTGEWMYVYHSLHELESGISAGELVTDDTLIGRGLAWMAAPLYQPQDTLNRMTGHFANVVGLMEGVPLSKYVVATKQVSELEWADPEPTWSPFNIVGRLYLDMGAPDDIPAALAASALRNPYDGEPFTWDAGEKAVVFRGLEPGERGEHRIH